MQKEKARIILTLDCPRNCSYCANNQPGIMEQAKEITEIPSGYKELIFTGGEPGFDGQKWTELFRKTRKVNPDAAIYVYAAWYDGWFFEWIKYINGVHYTIHSNANTKDILMFDALQKSIVSALLYTKQFEKYSFRLSVDPNLDFPFQIIIAAWKEIRIKTWKENGNCIIPVDEDFFILKGNCNE